MLQPSHSFRFKYVPLSALLALLLWSLPQQTASMISTSPYIKHEFLRQIIPAGSRFPRRRIQAAPAMNLTPQRQERLERSIGHRMAGLRLVLDGVADPGNRAACIRSAEALGLLHVHVVRPPSSPDQRKRDRRRHSRTVTMGSHKWINVQSRPSQQRGCHHE